ncbi:hypothetical protein [Sorangium sp. So ce388]|uniref:hypothetical protein n=1 Tax=Sorangium sp. So ce388 TaxID=3133309 RepID=UPI003F5C80B9
MHRRSARVRRSISCANPCAERASAASTIASRARLRLTTLRSLLVISRDRAPADGASIESSTLSLSAASSAATASPSSGRRSRAFEILRAISASSVAGSSGRSSRSRGGSSRTILSTTESGSLPWNGARPVRHL